MKTNIIFILIACLLLAGCTAKQTTEPMRSQNTAKSMTATPVQAGAVVLETDALAVRIGETVNEIYIQNTKTEDRFITAIDAEESETVKGVMRLKLQSLVTGSYYDLELKKETDFYSANQEITTTRQLLQGNGSALLELSFSLENGLSFKVEVELREDQLLIRIPRESLVETERFVFKKLQIAPNLLSATAQQAGYFLLPDGSGTLMELGNGKKGVYDEAVYGINKAFIYEAYAVAEQTVHLPVFGMSRDGGTVLALISQGAACARIFAATNGNETTRNRAYPTFVLRQEDAQYITEDAFQTVIEEELHLSSDLEVTYLFGEKDGGYSDMARLLRQYMVRQGMETVLPEGCVLVSIYGAVEEKQKLLGVPIYDKAGRITSCEAAAQMLSSISQWTDTTPVVRLAAWDTDTVKGYAVNSFEPVGTDKDFAQLLESCNALGLPVYLSEPFATARRSGQGISLKRDAIRNLANELSVQYSYYRASNALNTERKSWYYLDGSAVMERAEKLMTSMEDWGFTGLAVEDISALSYANYRKNAQCGQDTTVQAFARVLDALSVEHSLLLHGGYGYSLEYGAFVYDAPDGSSRFTYTDAQVPFYQMVLSGIKAYALTPVNQEENRRLAWLKALETGAWIHYELAEETAYLQGTELERLYGAKWSLVSELIQQELGEYEQALQCVVGSTIVKHARLGENVTRTHYENGWVVTVNYGAETVLPDGTVMEPESYLMERGDAQ